MSINLYVFIIEINGVAVVNQLRSLIHTATERYEDMVDLDVGWGLVVVDILVDLEMPD
ncbi:Hypothetical protein MVR_LOCUS53 [uncultured virus]|nr:Hypothetical protein MVR_LOCUS53 [uncultured virus]